MLASEVSDDCPRCITAVQIAICALLITSSMVAVRGLLHPLHGNFGFESRNAMLVAPTCISRVTAVIECPNAKAHDDAVASFRGVKSVGLSDALLLNDNSASLVESRRVPDASEPSGRRFSVLPALPALHVAARRSRALELLHPDSRTCSVQCPG
jgi:hypothetical protein